MSGCIALVVLERSSGTQLVFLKRLDLQPSAEDDGKGADDGNKRVKDDDEKAEDDGDVRGRVVVGFAAGQLGS